MKKLASMLTLFASAPLSLSADVSKEDLKKMVSAGLSDGVILCYVKAHGPLAKLSADEVLELKKAGLTEALLAGILAVPSPPPKPPPTPPEVTGIDPTYSPSVAYDDFWPGDYDADWGYFFPGYGLGFGFYGVPCFRGFCGNRFWNGGRNGRFLGPRPALSGVRSGSGGPRGGSVSGGPGGSGGGGHGGGHR